MYFLAVVFNADTQTDRLVAVKNAESKHSARDAANLACDTYERVVQVEKSTKGIFDIMASTGRTTGPHAKAVDANDSMGE